MRFSSRARARAPTNSKRAEAKLKDVGGKLEEKKIEVSKGRPLDSPKLLASISPLASGILDPRMSRIY